MSATSLFISAHDGHRRQHAPVREVPLACVGRHSSRNSPATDRCTGPLQAFVAHTLTLANSGSTEEVLAAFFYGREDIIPEMFRRLLDTLYGAKHNNDRLRHFVYYIDRRIELDADSHGPQEA
jgi:hypothetical protein